MLGIGELIRANRSKMGITQEELCFGVCSVGNLSKIENGEQVPTRAKFEAPMEKMGLSAGVYPSFLSDVDKRAYELQHDFNEFFSKVEYEEAENILNELAAIPKPEQTYIQFVGMSRILI